MTVRVGMFKSGMTAEDHRLALGILAMGTGTPLQTRSGLVPGSAPTYTKVSGMTARVSSFQGWIDGTAQSQQGGYPFTSDADEDLTFADGDATRDRIDLVVAHVYDNIYDASGQTIGDVHIVQGAYPSSGAPVAPAAPPNSHVLWEQPIPAGTTAGTGGIDVAQAVRRWVYTTAAGGVLPLRNQAEQDDADAYDGLVGIRLDTGSLVRRHQGAWGPSSDVTALDGRLTTVEGRNLRGSARGPAAQIDYTTTAIVVATTQVCEAGGRYEVSAVFGGTQITATGAPQVKLAGSAGVPTDILFFRTAAANETVYGSVTALYEPATTSTRAFQLVASTSAGALRIGANAACIWVTRIG